MFRRAVLSLLFVFMVPGICHAFGMGRGIRVDIIAPVIISPNSEVVIIEPGKSLELKWSPHERVNSGDAYYDLRIYKGYQPVLSAILHKVRLSKEAHSYVAARDIFKDGEIYTWRLRKVYKEIGNSFWNSRSFRVVMPEK
jgi:hypothetical protein